MSKSDPPELIKNRAYLKEAQREKYGYNFCQECKKTFKPEILHCHHIVYRSEAPSHRNLHKKRNLLLCCQTCHDKFHFAKREARIPWLKKRKLNTLFPELFFPEL